MDKTKTVRLTCVGDIMIHSRYNELADEKGTQFLFERVAGTLTETDLLFGNVETVLSRLGEPVGGKLCLRGDDRYVDTLGSLGFDVVSLANNHAFDFGAGACTDMARRLEAQGIAVVGVGDNLAASREMRVVEAHGFRVGFLAYSSPDTDGSDYAEDGRPGVAPMQESLVLEDVAACSRKVDHLIVSLHWGVEYSEYPTPAQVSLGRKVIDAGARMIIGHHPHILQGYEQYNGGYIFYSLGNFCDADLRWEGADKAYESKLKVADRESFIVAAELDHEGGVRVECLPLWLTDEGQPEIATGEKREEIAGKLEKRSSVLSMPDFDKYWEQMILDKRVGNAFRIWLDNGSLLDKVKNFKLSWFKTLWEMVSMYVQTKFSRSSDRYNLINPGKDKKPRPYCGKEPE